MNLQQFCFSKYKTHLLKFLKLFSKDSNIKKHENKNKRMPTKFTEKNVFNYKKNYCFQKYKTHFLKLPKLFPKYIINKKL